MKSINYLMTFVFLLISGDQVLSQGFQKVQLPSTHIREIESVYVKDRTYDLFIDLPPGYSTSDSNYPVVYMLDAYETFGLYLQTYQQLLFMHEIPELIIVGISYQIEGDFYTEGLREYLDIRARDYLPTYLTWEETKEKHGKFADYVRLSGGGKEFQSFLEKELIPFMESEYRTDPEQRSLFGYSLGGTFAIYSMLNKPGVFQKYFIGDAMHSWDDYAVFDFDQTDMLLGSKDTIDVYISWCDMETQDDSNIPLMKHLKNIDNPHIRYESEVLEGETHLSGIGLAYSRAFRSLYGLK